MCDSIEYFPAETETVEKIPEADDTLKKFLEVFKKGKPLKILKSANVIGPRLYQSFYIPPILTDSLEPRTVHLFGEEHKYNKCNFRDDNYRIDYFLIGYVHRFLFEHPGASRSGYKSPGEFLDIFVEGKHKKSQSLISYPDAPDNLIIKLIQNLTMFKTELPDFGNRLRIHGIDFRGSQSRLDNILGWFDADDILKATTESQEALKEVLMGGGVIGETLQTLQTLRKCLETNEYYQMYQNFGKCSCPGCEWFVSPLSISHKYCSGHCYKLEYQPVLSFQRLWESLKKEMGSLFYRLLYIYDFFTADFDMILSDRIGKQYWTVPTSLKAKIYEAFRTKFNAHMLNIRITPNIVQQILSPTYGTSSAAKLCMDLYAISMDFYAMGRLFRKYQDKITKEWSYPKTSIFYCGSQHIENYIGMFLSLGYTSVSRIENPDYSCISMPESLQMDLSGKISILISKDSSGTSGETANELVSKFFFPKNEYSIMDPTMEDPEVFLAGNVEVPKKFHYVFLIPTSSPSRYKGDLLSFVMFLKSHLYASGCIVSIHPWDFFTTILGEKISSEEELMKSRHEKDREIIPSDFKVKIEGDIFKLVMGK